MREVELEINLSKEFPKTKIIINASEMTDELEQIISKIQTNSSEKIIGFIEDEAFILEKENIENIYTENKKVLARYNNKTYVIKKRIFELESLLSENNNFVRISNSEIVNFKKVKSIDFKLTGTILLKLESGAITYTSRRYIKKIKDYLGV